jgi:hypothetical protein
VLPLVRWPLQGGAAPLKLAAVTATVATTATLAVVPLMREPAASKPAPLAPQADTPRRDVGVVPRTVQQQPAPQTKASPSVGETVVSSAGTQVTQPFVRADTPPTQAVSPPVHLDVPPALGDVSTTIVPPEVSVPSVSLGPVAAPEVTVAIPEVKLQLPAVELPPVPDLPKLP